MIPLRDLEKRPGLPPVTTALVVVNVATWIYTLTLVGQRARLVQFYDAWAFNAGPLFNQMRSGQLTEGAIVPLLSYQFVHGGWLHVAGNMLFLWVFGAAIEQRIGALRFLMFYLLAGCIAALTQGLYQLAIGEAERGLVGASGAISGVLGAYFVAAPRARVRALVPLGLFMTPITLPAILVLGEWVALQLISAFDLFAFIETSRRVAYFAHLGGFATGVAAFGVAALARRVRLRTARAIA